MPALQVRDFPPDLYEELKSYSAANHRSMAQQVIVAVEAMLHGANEAINAATPTRHSSANYLDTEELRQGRIKKRKELFALLHNQNEAHPVNISNDEIHRIIQEGRSERDKEILSSFREAGSVEFRSLESAK